MSASLKGNRTLEMLRKAEEGGCADTHYQPYSYGLIISHRWYIRSDMLRYECCPCVGESRRRSKKSGYFADLPNYPRAWPRTFLAVLLGCVSFPKLYVGKNTCVLTTYPTQRTLCFCPDFSSPGSCYLSRESDIKGACRHMLRYLPRIQEHMELALGLAEQGIKFDSIMVDASHADV